MARGLFNIQDIIDDNPFTGAVAPDPRGVGTTIRETSGFEIPSDLLIDTDIQREFFQDFMEIFRESQAEDDGRLERQTARQPCGTRSAKCATSATRSRPCATCC